MENNFTTFLLYSMYMKKNYNSILKFVFIKKIVLEYCYYKFVLLTEYCMQTDLYHLLDISNSI